MPTRVVAVNGLPRIMADLPEMLAEDYQPEKSNLTLLLRRAFQVEDDLLRRGA